ncbi:hypothetical protein [Sulfobacillus harzensis]|uniref:Glutamine cyclotransferase n=1 Tax=Sulfobacillus harzensis TaxID=2729629 RepID=A0A7Y0L9H2_9FIRM|nr:hypothetical protein [Sulfobacillus harzensis]NMP24975.1 hypothetical protein [Sulfobacillus harzensis]
MRMEVVRSVPAPGEHLCGVAWDGLGLWHSDGATNAIYQVDPETGEVKSELSCDDVRTCLGFDGNLLWQIAGTPKRIRLIRPTDGWVLDEIALAADSEAMCGLHVERDRYWLGSKATGIIEERDGSTHRLLRHWQIDGSVHGLARVHNTLWFTDYPARQLVGWDRNQNTAIARFDLPGHPTGLCRGAGDTLWYCDYTNRCLTQVEIQEH